MNSYRTASADPSATYFVPNGRGGRCRSRTRLQAALNPPAPQGSRGLMDLRPIARSQIENDYTRRFITATWLRRRVIRRDELTARFDSQTVTYGFGELDALVAYAATTKSQGRISSYDPVILSTMPCCSGTFSPALPGAKLRSCWSPKEATPSRCATSRVAAAGQN
ncbi:MAG: hypothetical protein Udaeo2_12770 [Candidatus Udaeobacter sp.]|nr:MAG: hypothetical protein Udaeo2_12770 [Candidatus Udaeobacter sp.]